MRRFTPLPPGGRYLDVPEEGARVMFGLADRFEPKSRNSDRAGPLGDGGEVAHPDREPVCVTWLVRSANYLKH